jgi:MFS transporter, DHA1 family, inner membrane transport protein
LARLASGYDPLLVSRIGTALSQALFWCIVVSSAAGLFPREVRGRAVGLVFAGSSLATVLGLPAGTWLGQHFGWRIPFAVVVLVSLAGLSFSAMTIALAGRISQVAPGSVDMANAGTSIAVNVGITAGAFIGSVLLPEFGARSTALAGGLFSIAALAAVFGELLLRSRAASPKPASVLVTTEQLQSGC